MHRISTRSILGIVAFAILAVACDSPTAPLMGPRVVLESPIEGPTFEEAVTVEFTLEDITQVSAAWIRINDEPEMELEIQPADTIHLSRTVELREGANEIEVRARNWAHLEATATVEIYREPLVDLALRIEPLARPGNVLSAWLHHAAPDGDSIRIRYWTADGQVRTTPAFAPPYGDSTLLLGLRPDTEYTAQLEIYTDAHVGRSQETAFRTNALPPDLASAHIDVVEGATTRYAATTVATSATTYAVIFDPEGTLAWYRDFGDRNLPVSNLMPLETGNFTAFLGGTHGWQATHGYYVELTMAGEIVREYEPPPLYFMDNHEIRLTGDPEAPTQHYFTYYHRTVDMTPFGGPGEVRMAGHQLIRTGPAGNVELTWDAWDRIALEEWLGDDDLKAERTEGDFSHPNSLSFDPNGDYVVSWRNLDQVMGIDAASGEVLWRVGGLEGEYEFVGDPAGGFSKQHSAHILPDGNLLLYDNGTDADPRESRAVEYRLDHEARTATLVWEYRHAPPIYTPFVGWVERLSGGETWVAFSGTGRVAEVARSGDVLWDGQLLLGGAPVFTYRIRPIDALYR